MLYLEDLKVGDHFKSDSYLMTLEEILAFAEKFDPQPFHLNEMAAAEHPVFQGLAASGWHTAAVTMRLWTQCFPVAYGLIGSESHVRWPRPTRPLDQLRVEVHITDIKPSRSKPDRAIVSYETQTFNQDDQVVYTSSTKILVFSKLYKQNKNK
jgi:acyl dehydratase